MSQSSTLAASVLDLSARSIDLVSVVAKSSGSLASAGTELIKWLAREGIPDEAFLFAMTKAQDFADPNPNGAVVLKQLNVVASRLYGLQLVMPGALGRIILADNRLRWIATTEAVILKYHDMAYTIQVLCSLFLARTRIPYDGSQLIYSTRLQPVVTKMVTSIGLHAINMGNGVGPLPDSLEALPKHYLTPQTFAESVQTIQGISQSDILVQVECCAIDLLSWIYHHWIGTLSVSGENTIIFHEPVGESSLNLTFMITNPNRPDGNVGSIWIGTYQESSFKASQPVYEGSLGSTPDFFNYSGYRSQLYEFRNPFTLARVSLGLNNKETRAARISAQDIVRSILELPVGPADHGKLRLIIKKSAETKFRWWLARTPALLQENLSDSKTPTRPLFTADDGRKSKRNIQYDLISLVHWYPEIADATKTAAERCECGCQHKMTELDEGCLQAVTIAEVLMIVGHSMADAAGAADVSNFRGSESARSLLDATMNFLGRIVCDGEITWETWFRLAAAAITGTPGDLAREERISDNSGELLCWTAGSMSLVPKWFELDKELNLAHSWAIRTLNGRIIGVDEEQAIVETQASTNGSFFDPPEQRYVSGGSDSQEVSVFSSVLCKSGSLYRIMTLVRAGQALRVFDPSRVYRGLMLSKRPNCSHSSTEKLVFPWNFERLIQAWGLHAERYGEYGGPLVHVALLEGSPLKQNIAIGFAPRGCTVQSDKCCFKCLVDVAKAGNNVGVCCRNNRKHNLLGFSP